MTASCAFLVHRTNFLANALSGDALTAFEAHAATCTECTGDIAAWRSFGAALSSQLGPVRREPTSTEVGSLVARAQAPKAWPPRWVVPSVGVLALAAAAVFIVTRPAAQAPEVAWVPAVVASSRDFQQVGSAFSTLADGHALVKVGDDEFGLGAATSLEVQRATTNGTVLTLKHGVVAAQVNPARGPRNFDIETALGRVHVVGTVLRVTASGEALQVDVIRSVVEVESRSGVRTKVPAGRGLRLVRETTGGEVVPFEANEFPELLAAPPAVAPASTVPEVVDAGSTHRGETRRRTGRCVANGSGAWRVRDGDCGSRTLRATRCE